MVRSKIAAIGDTNPLLSLVEFSTAFDPETLQDVITKLETIKQNVEASKVDDQRDEQASEAMFN
jgi:hypothetical protein